MKILVSGLLNTETTAAVRGFPINYYPIDYPFFGVNTSVSGVAFNIAKALTTLGDEVSLCSMVGEDFEAEYIRRTLAEIGVSDSGVKSVLQKTPSSVVLYDPSGARQIYCDLKDIQERQYDFLESALEWVDLVVACNINFNRPLLHLAKKMGKTVATDVHVLSDSYDVYNREFMECADILFLSDEAVGDNYRELISRLYDTYHNKVIVIGRGAEGAAMYLGESGELIEMPAHQISDVVNTVGAGDALFSAFVHFYSKGGSPVESLVMAQKFAAHKITVGGASAGFLTEAELEGLT